MKTLFKTTLFGLAIVAGVGITYAFNANKTTTLVYSYNLSTSTGAKNPANWTLQTSPGSSCGTPGSTPCRVSFNSSEYADISAYLDDQHFTSDAEVVYGPGVISKD